MATTRAARIRDAIRPKLSIRGKIKRWARKYDHLLPDGYIIRRNFKEVTGRRPDLANPRTLYEKICWIKLQGTTELHRTCADKVKVREYVRARIGEKILIPVVLITNKVEDINPNKINNKQFVIKANHDSGSFIICTDRQTFDWEAARNKISLALKNDYHMKHRERQYEGIDRKIIVEERLHDSSGFSPNDIKIFCFHGKAKLAVCLRTSKERGRIAEYYDLNWNALPIVGKYPRPDDRFPKPKHLDEIIEIAERLTAPFAFCRADFYECEDQIYFGELTFSPAGGNNAWTPAEWDLKAGSWIQLEKL